MSNDGLGTLLLGPGAYGNNGENVTVGVIPEPMLLPVSAYWRWVPLAYAVTASEPLERESSRLTFPAWNEIPIRANVDFH